MIEPPGLGFVMVKRDFRCPEDLQSRGAQLQGIIGVTARDRQTDFVKPLVSVEDLAARGKKSSGNRRHRSRHMPATSRTRLETVFV